MKGSYITEKKIRTENQHELKEIKNKNGIMNNKNNNTVIDTLNPKIYQVLREIKIYYKIFCFFLLLISIGLCKGLSPLC